MKKTNKVILSEELEKALRGFVPIFGNEQDIWILEKLGKLKDKLMTIDNVAFRRAESTGDRHALTSKMQDIQREESSLALQITRRNFDF